MKKTALSLVCAALLVSFAACSSKDKKVEEENLAQVEQTSPEITQPIMEDVTAQDVASATPAPAPESNLSLGANSSGLGR